MKHEGKVKWRGVAFEYGDDVIIVPPLPLDDVRDQQKKMSALMEKEGGADGDALYEQMRETILLAIRLNYSEEELPDAEIRKFVNMRNLPLLNAAATGMEKDSKGEAQAFGHLARDPKEVMFVGGVANYNPLYQATNK